MPSERFPIGISFPAGPGLVAFAAATGVMLLDMPEYMEQIKLVNAKAADVYRYMNFDQIPAFVEIAETVEM
jgi:aconitate hydratase 2/2-methylisocitrate dehydratase